MSEEIKNGPVTFANLEDVRTDDPKWVQMQKYRMKNYPGKKLTIPTGITLEAHRFANVRPPGTDDSFVLHSPEQILKRPRPGCRYIWRLRNDEETMGLVETDCIRPVTMDEIIRDRRTSKILGYVGQSGTKYVGWKRHALFEVSPEQSYEWFGQPEEWSLAKLAQLGPSFESEVEETTKGKMQGSFEARDTRPASRDKGAEPTRR